jgi:predicted nucleic acid-binding protein
MTKAQLLFDSNIIYRLIREVPESALKKLDEGSTINLAYYELGNALWRETFLLKRINIEEAKKSLDLMYSLLDSMQVTSIDNPTGSEVLQRAYESHLTFYDAAYLVEAKKSGKTLVTDDNKLAKAAENLGIKVLSSNALMQ